MLVILLCEVLFVIQDHDHRVAETAVVGFPHDLYGEGTHIHIHVYVLHLCTFVMYVYKLYCVYSCVDFISNTSLGSQAFPFAHNCKIEYLCLSRVRITYMYMYLRSTQSYVYTCNTWAYKHEKSHTLTLLHYWTYMYLYGHAQGSQELTYLTYYIDPTTDAHVCDCVHFLPQVSMPMLF